MSRPDFSAEIVGSKGVIAIPLESKTERAAYYELRRFIDKDPSVLDGEIEEVVVIEYYKYDKAHFINENIHS